MWKIITFLKEQKIISSFSGFISSKNTRLVYKLLNQFKIFLLVFLLVSVAVLNQRQLISRDWIYIIQIIVAVIIAYTSINSDFEFLKDDNDLKLKSYINSGVILSSKKNVFLNNIVKYYFIRISFWTLYFMLINIFLAARNNLISYSTLLLIILEFLCCLYSPIKIRQTIKSCKSPKNKVTKFIILLMFIVLPKIEVNNLSSTLKNLNSEFSYICSLAILCLYMLLTYYYSNRQKENTTLLKTIKATGIMNDFIQKELINRIYVLLLVSVFINKINTNIISKSLISLALLTFFSTQFNQRYLLSKSFFKYISMFGKPHKPYNYIFRKLIFLELLISFIFYFISNNFLLIPSIIFLFSFFVNLLIQNNVYKSISNIQETTSLKMTQIEIFSGAISSILLIGGISWIMK